MDKIQKMFLIIVATFIVLIVLYSIYFFAIVRILESDKKETVLNYKERGRMQITVIGEWGDIYTNVENIKDNGTSLYINSNEYVSILYYGSIDCDLGKKAMKYARDMIISANYYNKDNVLINFYNFGEGELEND